MDDSGRKNDSGRSIDKVQAIEEQGLAAARARSPQSLSRAQGRVKSWTWELVAIAEQLLKFRMIEAKPKSKPKPLSPRLGRGHLPSGPCGRILGALHHSYNVGTKRVPSREKTK